MKGTPKSLTEAIMNGFENYPEMKNIPVLEIEHAVRDYL